MTASRSAQKEVVEYRQMGPSRVDVLEERVSMQERTLKNLIDRAFKIKEDVINSLNYTQGTWQEEHKARLLLQDHVKTITNIVNKLNHEIAGVEEQIRTRDTSIVGTNSAVKNLEVHHVASLTDLRGRVVRCDTAIAKLSSDLRNITDTIKSTNQLQLDDNAKTVERMHALEGKVAAVNNSIDKTSSEQTMKMQQIMGDTTHQINMLDTKTRSLVDDIKSLVKTHHASIKTEHEKIESRLTELVEKSSADTDGKLNQLARKIEESNKQMESRFKKMDESMAHERSRVDSINKALETKLHTWIESDLRQQTNALSQVKRECREGFATVHESITNMKTVVDGKRRLLEEQLRRDIGQIRKMVVLV